MKIRLCSMIVIRLLIVGVTLAQSQGRGPAGGPPTAVGNAQQGQANKASEHSNSAKSPQNDVATRLSKNTALMSKLQGMLPAGMTIEDATRDFKTPGQFVAAVHVSKNLGIDFVQLKGAMLTTHKSLGDAIHDLKPALTIDQANAEAKKAEERAKEESKNIS